MDELQKAKLAAERINDMKSYERAQACAAEAAAYAAIAQAEQLKRIADILEYQMADTPRPHDGTWAVVDGLNQRID